MVSMGFISRHAVGVLIVLVIGGWALFYVPTTPSYAIYQLKQAIDARDGATAATFVDFRAWSKNAGYEMLQQNSQANDVITALVGKGAVDLLSAPMAVGVQQWATQQVNSGAKQVQMPAAAVAGAVVMLHHSGDAAWTDFRDDKGVRWGHPDVARERSLANRRGQERPATAAALSATEGNGRAPGDTT